MNTQTIEYAPFSLKSDVSIDQLIEAADHLHSVFIGKQEGMISRELIQSENGVFADLIHWESEAASKNASSKVPGCPACAAYFELMEVAEAKQIFTRFSILRSYESLL